MQEIPRPPKVVRFGAFQSDLQVGGQRKNGLKIKLQEKPFQILAILLEHHGEVVTREELRRRLWPEDTFVDFDHSVNTAINKLREALGDSAENPRFIETLPRHGYRFIAPASAAEGATHESSLTAGPQERRHEERPAVIDRRHNGLLAALVAAGVAATLAVLLAFNVTGLRRRVLALAGAPRSAPLPKIESIAVLPLENLSGDPAQEYFAEGMTEELITDLGKISALRVISRTTVMRYKGTKKALPEIAKELNVDAIVEGTVRRSGGRVAITANLLYAPADRHLWSETYERELGDVLRLQGELANDIANEVRIRVTSEEQAFLTSKRTVNPEAHEAYLRGRFLLSRWTLSHSEAQGKKVEDLAREYFQLALKKDPNYAPGYVGMSMVGEGCGNRECLPREAGLKAKAAALKALELDNGLADAHGALASVLFWPEWNWTAAEREFKRAIELDPNSAELRVHYVALLHALRRPQEAKVQIERARQLDPLNPRVQNWYVLHLMFSRQYDTAIAQAREMLRMEPDALVPHIFLQSAFKAKGLFQERFVELKKAWAGDPEVLKALDRGYGRGGYREAMRLAAATLERRGACNVVLYADAGENDRAFECMEKEYAAGNGAFVFLGVAPDIESLRSDPRYKAFLRRMNLPP